MAASASILPWLWVVEALASFKQVDASILIDLVKRTPEISDDLGKNAREKVSLRILESFVAQKIGSRKGVSSAPDSKIEFDPSEHCEDVVRNILHEISASNLRTDEPEIWKWDVQTFITHKSASLSKCTLQQLKDAILEGNHPILASLRERSGLSISKQSENRISVDNGDLNAVSGKFEGSCSYGQTMEAGGNITSPTPENLDGFLQGDTLDNDSLLSKRNRVDLVMENQVSRSHEDRNSTDNGFVSHLHNVKKLKKDATSTSQPVGQESVLIIGNELSEDLFGRNGQHTDLAKLSRMGGLEESRFLEHIASKIHVQGNDADDTELQHNHSLISCNNNTVPQDTSRDGPLRDYPIIDVMDDEHCAEMGTPNVPQDTSGDGPQRDPPIIEAKDDEHCAEMRKPNVAPLVGTHQNICGDEARDKYEKSLLNTSNGAPLEGSYQNNFPNEAKDDVDHNPGQEMSSDSDGYQDEKTDVALKKHTFLSSQCTFSQDSLTTADYTELNLCMKCNKGGQLLGCSASACPLVVHQTCLGSAPSFDDNGKFYCPFCAYSQAISVYLEVKKKASLSRKDLAAFVGLENEHRANKLSKRFHRPEQDQLIQDEDNLNGNNRANYNGSYANEVISSQYKENIGDKQQVEPSVSCVKGNLPCQEGGTTIDDGAPHLLTEHNRKDPEGGKIGPGSQSASVLKGQQIEEQSVSNLDHNSSCRDTEIVHATKIRGEDIMQKEVLQPLISDSTQKTPCPQNIDAGESSEEENDKPTPNYSRPLRRREKQYTYPAIPQLRRKKVPWTSVEEEILKEGVRRFSSVHDRNIPWKRILEFGSHVFEKGRTTIDLKDKWRNICKGSPKPK